MNEWKFGKLQKKDTQNLTRCNIFNSKSDALYFWIQNMTLYIFLNSKSDALYFFKFKIWRVGFF